MKYSFVPVLLIAALIACKSKTKPVAKDSVVTPAVVDPKAAAEETKGLLKELKPVLHGVWVQSSFINTILKTKSPFAAQNITARITTLVIDTNQIRNDRVQVPVE